MKIVRILITIGMIAIVKAQTPTCIFMTDADGLLTCKLLDGSVSPDNINIKIIGDPGKGKTFDDVQKLYSLQATTTETIYTIFNNFINLRKLELTNGMVESITQAMLYNCSKLEKLVLNKGTIKTIDANTFVRCPELTEIDLQRNNITGIVSGAFNGLSKLKTLKFSSNQLSTISPNVFNVPSLESLDLSKNELRLTNTSIFTYVKELVSLNLAENGIEFIIKEQFKGLDKLTELDFTNNGLNATQDTALEYLKALKVAKFAENVCIDKNYTDYSQSDFAGDFSVCIQNFNGAPILILSILALVVSIVVDFFYYIFRKCRN